GFESVLDELICFQQNKLLGLAREIVPYITQDDLLQVFDFPELEQCAFFRYEEGVLEGLLTAKTSYLRWVKEN
ncbi:MAG: hypothetical protein FJZ63_08060, partial [Chlamydiae bacterium]|nr:hypothetical protein [Chlamydiota bacterium]